MTPEQMKQAGQRLYGQKKWQTHLADALGVDASTIFRMAHRKAIPGPYVVAINSLLEHKRQQDELNKQAKRLLRDRNRLLKARRGDKPKRKRRVKEDDLPQTFGETDSGEPGRMQTFKGDSE